MALLSLPKLWWNRKDSNLRPPGYEPDALHSELQFQNGARCRNRTDLSRFLTYHLTTSDYRAKIGGKGEIRTHGPLRRSSGFRPDALNHSATFPKSFKIGSGSWTRTTVRGVKDRCPTIRRTLNNQKKSLKFWCRIAESNCGPDAYGASALPSEPIRP